MDLSSYLAAYLEPCPLGYLSLATPTVGRIRLRETLSPGPQVLNSPICYSGWPVEVRALGPGSKELAEQRGSGASSFLWVRDRCSF